MTPAEKKALKALFGQTDEAADKAVDALRGYKTRTVYHGSPHDFDAFDLNKIGTGEGKQAYGHGLYFTESDDVAKGYRDKLQGRIPAGMPKPSDSAHVYAAKSMYEAGMQDDEVIDALRKAYKGASDDELRLAMHSARPGKLYRAEIPTGDYMLDWDETLDDLNPDIIDRLKKTDWWEYAEESLWNTSYDRNPTGKDLYNWLLEDYTPEEASKMLNDVGIVGINYVGDSSGVRNAVVFDDKLVKILEKGNVDPKLLAALGITAGGVAMAMPQDAEAGVTDDVLRAIARQSDEALGMSEAARMARAGEQGFSYPVYHYSRHGADIQHFGTSQYDLSPFGIGPHVGTKQAAAERAAKTRADGASYPLLMKGDRVFLDPDGKPWNEEKLSAALRKIQTDKFGEDFGNYAEARDWLANEIWSKYDAIPYINDVEDAGSVSYIVNPSAVRSVNAKFDPANIGKNDLLGAADPRILAPTAAAAAGAGVLMGDPGADEKGIVREPYPSELEYFRANPNVAGMAAEDDKVILNPFSSLSEDEKRAVALNEAARIYMRRNGTPEIPLTDDQRERFSDYGSERDARETVLARILSGDPSAGTPTQDQRRFVESVLKPNVRIPQIPSFADPGAAFDFGNPATMPASPPAVNPAYYGQSPPSALDSFQNPERYAKPSVLDYLKGAGDVVADTASGMLYPVATGFPTVMDYAMGVDAPEMVRRREGRQDKLNYQPRTQMGQQWSQAGQDAIIKAIMGVAVPAYEISRPFHPVIKALWGKLGEREKLALEGLLDMSDIVF